MKWNEAKTNLELVTNRWESDEEMFSDSMDISIDQEFVDTLYIAIKAIEELQQYRAIGTLEECRTAVAKQIAQTPDFEGDGYSDGHIVYDTWICPGCGEHYEIEYDKYEYCPHCGQKISWDDWNDWENEDDEE